MKFLCLAYLDRGLSPGPGVAAEYDALTRALRAADAYVDGGQLSPSGAAKTVRVTDGKAEAADGTGAHRVLRHRLRSISRTSRSRRRWSRCAAPS